MKSINSTSTTSPSFASSIKIGPVTGFTLEKSKFFTSSIVESIFNCEPDESTVSISIVSPDLISITGLLALSHPKWCCNE